MIESDTIRVIQGTLRYFHNKHIYDAKHTEGIHITNRYKNCTKKVQKECDAIVEKSGWFNKNKKTKEWHYSLKSKPREVYSEIHTIINGCDEEIIQILEKYI
jgi:hypothetical protein